MKKHGTEGAPINVGLIGLGNVGKGVARYFQEGRGEARNIHLTRVAVADPSRPREVAVPRLTGDAQEIFQDPNIHIIVELMGGIEPAGSYLLDGIDAGKSIVTANKALIAAHAKDVLSAATIAGVDVGYEGSVAGGIPIISTFSRYKGEKIQRVKGIFNGTTNFILTQMGKGLSFEKALQIAQEEGFAEQRHILDTGGFDTRDKLAILASMIFNAQVDPGRIDTQGITDITPIDLDFASKLGVEEGGPGYAVKLLASADRRNGSVELRVNPSLIRRDHPLAAVDNEFNGVYYEGDLVGPVLLTGKGAGTDPTTSAVVTDIDHIADNIRRGVVDELPTLDENIVFVPPGATEQAGYIRVNLLDRPGSTHEVSGIMANHGLNRQDSRQQKAFAFTTSRGTVIPDIITVDPVSRTTVNTVLEELRQSDRVHGEPIFMSIEN